MTITRYMTFGVQYGNPALGDWSSKEPHPTLPFVTGNGYVRLLTDGFEPGEENVLRLLLHEAIGGNRYAFLYGTDESRGPTTDRALEHNFYPAGELAVLHLTRGGWGWECADPEDCTDRLESEGEGQPIKGRGCPVHTYGLREWVA